MTQKIAVMLAEGFEEMETVAVVDLIRRAGGRVSMISLQENTDAVSGSRGMCFVPDAPYSSLQQSFDALILPGGIPGVPHLHADTGLKEKLLEMCQEEKLIATICAASSILADYGILRGKHATSHPTFREQTEINGCIYSEERVVVDGNIITSRAPGTAIEFAFSVIEKLYGKKRVQQLNAGVLALFP